jgi:CTP-dependent riboflavin kinase
MTTKTAKMVLILGILAVLIVSVAGCTSSTQNASSGSTSSAATAQQTPTARDYAQNYLNATIASLGKNETLTNAKIIGNETDTAQLSYAITNTTSQPVIYTTGFTTTYGLNVTRFPSVEAATQFYEQTSLGYTPYQPTLNASVYKTTTGHNPTINNESRRLNSITQASIATQQDEFVTWGIASVTSA